MSVGIVWISLVQAYWGKVVPPVVVKSFCKQEKQWRLLLVEPLLIWRGRFGIN